MRQKLFPLDKNYILKEAQWAAKESLLEVLIKEVKFCYLSFCNPLGIEDDTVLKIKKADISAIDTKPLDEFYEHLSGIYRYKFGSNQLEFLFDGKNHFVKYQEDWAAAFIDWIKAFCLEENFLRAILEVTIFYPTDRKALLAGNRLKSYISQQFEIKVYKYKGIIPLR